ELSAHLPVCGQSGLGAHAPGAGVGSQSRSTVQKEPVFTPLVQILAFAAMQQEPAGASGMDAQTPVVHGPSGRPGLVHSRLLMVPVFGYGDPGLNPRKPQSQAFWSSGSALHASMSAAGQHPTTF